MIHPTLTDVKYYARDAIVLSWELDNTASETFTDYRLLVYRSENQNSDFRFIANSAMNDVMFVDCAVSTRSKNRRYYYKLLVKNISTVETSWSEVMGIGSDPDVIALEIIRRERLLLKQYLKNKCFIYIPRLSGPKCSSCYDEMMGRRTSTECKACYGTGFECGFYTPISSYVKIDPDAQIFQAANFGPMEASETNAWITSWPRIPINSYIFEIETGMRWRVSQIGKTEKSRYVIRQLLRLRGEDRGSIIYDIHTPTWVQPWDNLH